MHLNGATATVRRGGQQGARGTRIGVRTGAFEKRFEPVAYKLFTESAQSTGLENIGHERTLSSHLAPRPVLSATRITLENNGKIRPRPDRENAFSRACGGGAETGSEPSLAANARLCRVPVILTSRVDCIKKALAPAPESQKASAPTAFSVMIAAKLASQAAL